MRWLQWVFARVVLLRDGAFKIVCPCRTDKVHLRTLSIKWLEMDLVFRLVVAHERIF